MKVPPADRKMLPAMKPSKAGMEKEQAIKSDPIAIQRLPTRVANLGPCLSRTVPTSKAEKLADVLAMAKNKFNLDKG